MSWFGEQKDTAQLQAELNGLKAYKINADSALRKLKVRNKQLQDKVKVQEKEIDAKHHRLSQAMRKIQSLSSGSQSPPGTPGALSTDSELASDFKRLVDENVSIKKRMEEMKEEYATRRRALETNMSILMEEIEGFKQKGARKIKNNNPDAPTLGEVDNTKIIALQERVEIEANAKRELEDELTRMVQKMKTLTSEGIQIREKSETLERVNIELRKQLKEFGQATGVSKPEGSDVLVERVKKLQHDLQGCKQQNHELREQNKMLTWERVDLKQEVENLKSKGKPEAHTPSREPESKSIETQSDSRQTEVEELRLEILNTSKKAKEATQEKEKLESLLEETRRRESQTVATYDEKVKILTEKLREAGEKEGNNLSNTYRQRLAQTQDKFLKLRNAYQVSQSHVKELERIVKEKDSMIENMPSENEWEEKLTKLKSKNANFSEKLAQSLAEKIELQDKLQYQTDEVERLKKQTDNLKSKLESTQTELSGFQTISKQTEASLRCENKELDEKYQKISASLSTAKESMESLEVKIKLLSDTSEKANFNVSNLKEERKTLLSRLASSDKSVKSLESETMTLREENKKYCTQIKDLEMKRKIEKKKTQQLIRDLKKSLKRDALKSTEVKAELTLEKDRSLNLEAQLKKAENKVKHIQKRLLVQGPMPDVKPSGDLSKQAKLVLTNVSALVDATIRRILEADQEGPTQIGGVLDTPLPPPLPALPKPNTPQAEFVEDLAARYESAMNRAHQYEEKIKYLQESMRMLNQDCEKKKQIIQAFLLETARDPGKDFVSKFGNTPEHLRDLLLHRMEVILQDAIVQNIRLRDQISGILTSNNTLRAQNKKKNQTIERCRHVILKLRAKTGVSAESPGSPQNLSILPTTSEDAKFQEDPSDAQVLDAADALEILEISPETEAKSKKLKEKSRNLGVQLLDAPLEEKLPSTQDVESKNFPSNSPVSVPISDSSNSNPSLDPNPSPTEPKTDEEDLDIMLEGKSTDGRPVVYSAMASSNELAEDLRDAIKNANNNDDDDDGPEVAEIPLS